MTWLAVLSAFVYVSLASGDTLPTRPFELCTSSDCADIDICATLNRGQWLHMSNSDLTGDPVIGLESAVPFYDIQSALVPEGVQVELCAPDFAYYIRNGRGSEAWTCDETTLAVVVEEIGSKVESLSDKFRMQMVKIDFAEGYGCDIDTSPGWDARPPNSNPQRLVNRCASVLENGHYDVNCSAVCDGGFVFVNDTCIDACPTAPEYACGPLQRAASTCASTGSADRYQCVDCELVPGLANTPWSVVEAGACVSQPCASGRYTKAEHDGSCEECAVEHYSNGSHPCRSCDTNVTGLYQPLPGAAACEPCFGADFTPTCELGRMLSVDFSYVTAYFVKHARVTRHADVLHYCYAGGACLPCPPGTYGEGGTCEPCALGTYQNGFAQLVCIPCLSNQTTLQTASTAAKECVCEAGTQ